jgi:superfamily II DNA or RNA helicase/REP element-mobilizing transposase RayT
MSTVARIVIGGKYGRDIMFVGNVRFLPAGIARVVRDYFGQWNTLRDITRYPALVEELGNVRAHRHFNGTDWEALDAFYKQHMQGYSLVFKGSLEGEPRFAVGCPGGQPAKALAAIMRDFCAPSGQLNDSFDLWRLDKLLRRAKGQIKYAPSFTEALKVFGATAISFEESLSFFRQVQAYHSPHFLKPELKALLEPCIDHLQTLREPLVAEALALRLREAGGNVRVDHTVQPVLEHYAKLAECTRELVGATSQEPEHSDRATPVAQLDRVTPVAQLDRVTPVAQLDRVTPVAHKGFYRRGYLPHFDNPGAVQFITFRLADSLPLHQVRQLKDANVRDPALQEKITAWLDTGHGECWLSNPSIAQLVQDTLLHFDGDRYRMLAWVIMPNHVHVVVETLSGTTLAQTVRSWKNFTAREANKFLQRTGQFWQHDYFDRAPRDEQELYNIIDYIHNNPVKAGLVARAEDYPWSSASGDLRTLLKTEDARLGSRGPVEQPAPAPSPLDELISSVHLYPFQREGVAFLVTNGRALLADDMGLGKTIQAIAAAVYLKQTQGLKRALVICPASLKYQWQAEIKRFTGERAEVIGGEPAERESIYRATAHEGGFILPQDKAFFYIVNYELVHRDLDQLKKLDPDLLIVDEAQRVKNFRTKTAQAVFELPAPRAFVLTGTPLENQLMELFTIVRFIDERALGRNPVAFRERYVIQDHFGGILGYQRVDEVTRKIASITLRRTKEQTLTELPELIEVPRWLELTGTQRKLYQELQGQAREMLAQHVWDGVQTNNALTVLQRLRETCDTAELIDPELRDSQKLEELLSLLEDEVRTLGRQALIFTQWTRMGEILMRELKQAKFAPAFLHGGVPANQRPEMVRRFQDGRDRILVSTDAGGTGLNLQAASLVVNYDLPFNPAKLSQRIARAHRLGQTGSVVVVNLLSRGTVEEKMVRILSEKRELFQDVFGEISDQSQIKGQQLNIRELLREVV